MPEFQAVALPDGDDYTDDVSLEELADISNDETESGLSLLAEAMQEQLDRPEKFPIPNREGWFLECRVDLGHKELERLQKMAKKDTALFDRLILVAATVGIYKGDKLVVDSEGDALTFTSQDMLTTTGTQSAAAAAKKFLGRDGVITALAQGLTAESGYGKSVSPDEVEGADPTSSGG